MDSFLMCDWEKIFTFLSVRDMTTEINFFLWNLGTSQIREESQKPEEDPFGDMVKIPVQVSEDQMPLLNESAYVQETE